MEATTNAARWRVFSSALILLAVSTLGGPIGKSAPDIRYVYPAGGQRGTSFDVEIGGSDLEGATALHISGGGAVAAIVPALSREMLNALRRDLVLELQALLDTPENAATAPKIAELECQIAVVAGKVGRLGSLPDGMTTVGFRVTLARDAELGARELRVETAGGLSNPRPFHVGDLPEFRKTEVDVSRVPTRRRAGAGGDDGPDDPDAAATGTAPPVRLTPPQGSTLLFVDDAMRNRTRAPPAFALPATVNGVLFYAPPRKTQSGTSADFCRNGQVDRFAFQARAGQQLVITAVARELKPYLGEGSPGWFQPVLTLLDSRGNEVAFCQAYRFQADPVILFRVPSDGEYVLEIRDAVYRGRWDFVYRLTVGEQPFITSMFPLGGRADTQTSVSIEGWNLPAATLTQDARGKGPGIGQVTLSTKEGLSNPRPFAVDTLPEVLEQEPNDTPERARHVTLPIIVNGRIGQPGDWDVVSFAGSAGQEIVARVAARRLYSPLDSGLRLTDATGKQLAFNDDFDDRCAGLETHHADSYIRAVLPAAGTYYLHLCDMQNRGGPEYAYRLHIRPPQPDFSLRVEPASINAQTHSAVPITVHVIGHDGFSGSVVFRDPAHGFKLSAGYISPTNKNGDLVRFSLTAPATPLPTPVNLVLEGAATIAGQEVVHAAVPVEKMNQAFGASFHLVPAQEFLAVVREREVPAASAPAGTVSSQGVPANLGVGKTGLRRPGQGTSPTASAPPGNAPSGATILSRTPISIPIEGTARVEAELSAPLPAGAVLLLSDPPSGITIAPGPIAGVKVEFVVQSDPDEGSRPGDRGTLVVCVRKPKPKGPLGIARLAEIPFEVVVPPAQGSPVAP